MHKYTHTLTLTLSLIFSLGSTKPVYKLKKKKTIALADSIVLHSPPSSNMSPV